MAEMVKVPGVGPVKKQYVYAGVGATVLILGFAYLRRSQAPAEEVPVETGTTGEVGYDDGSGAYALGTGESGYNSMYYPGGSGLTAEDLKDAIQGVIDAQKTDTGGYETKEEWSYAARGALTDVGVDAQAAATAISLVLAGLAVTTVQQRYFLQAVGIIGTPPGGYPTIRVVDSPAQPTTPSTSTPGSSLGMPGGLKTSMVTKNYIRLDWNPVPKAKSYAVYAVADPPGGSTPGGVRQGTIAITEFTVRGLKPNTRYRFDVHAVGTDGKNGPRARIYVYTKK